MSIQPQPPVLSVSKVKNEPPTVVIKNEPPEIKSSLNEMFDSSEPDVKDINIVYHPICEDSIKSEIPEGKHYEFVETHDSVKAEFSPIIKTENITQGSKIKVTSSRGTGQKVVEVKGEITSKEKDQKKIKVIEAPMTRVEPHEYTSLAKGKYICNHCQNLGCDIYRIKRHIKQMHREITTMYQCPYCQFKSKWKPSVQSHIIHRHSYIKKMQQFQYHCDKCNYSTYINAKLKIHNLIHLKPDESQYFYCYRCSFKSKYKGSLKAHVSTHRKKNVPVNGLNNFMTLKRESQHRTY